MDLKDFASMLRRNWTLILISILVGVGVAAVYSLAKTPEYEATSKNFVSTASASSVTDLNQGGTFTQQVVKSYADVATTPYVLDPVIRALNLATSPSQLATQLSVDAPQDTVIIEITARSESPSQAAQIANAVSARLSGAVVDLTPSFTSNQAGVRATQIQKAEIPTTPSSPNVALNLVLGLLLGLAIGILVSFLRERLDTRVRGLSDVVALTGYPVLGTVLFSAEARANPLADATSRADRRAESYRTLRTNLQFQDYDTTAKSLAVTSSVPSEGKSTTAVNLASSMAEAGRRVVLVDTDLRRPQIAPYLGLDGGIGVVDVLIGQASIKDAIQIWGTDGLHVLPSGRVPPNPSELLQSRAMERLVAALAEEYDNVIYDTPPVLAVSDAAIVARHADGTLLITAAGRARKQGLQSAITALDRVGARVLGVVVTMLRHSRSGGHGYEYGYAYNYDSAADLGLPVSTPASGKSISGAQVFAPGLITGERE